MGGAIRCLSSTEYMSFHGSRKAPNLSIVSTWVDLVLQTGGRFAPRKPPFGRRAHPPLLLEGERRKWAYGNQAMQIVSSEMMPMALSFSAPLFGPTKSSQQWRGVRHTHRTLVDLSLWPCFRLEERWMRTVLWPLPVPTQPRFSTCIPERAASSLELMPTWWCGTPKPPSKACWVSPGLGDGVFKDLGLQNSKASSLPYF